MRMGSESAGKMPESQILVGQVGVEPTPLSRHRFKRCAYTNSATVPLEAQTGIEPAHRGFADRCVSTSPLGLIP